MSRRGGETKHSATLQGEPRQTRSAPPAQVARALTALASIAALMFGSGQPAHAQYGFDCAHGPDTYRVRGVESWDVLNVRAGPSSRNSIVGRLPPNAAGIACLGPCQGSWCRIGWRNVSGWVNMRYLGE